MSGLHLDDAFALKIAKSMNTNTTIEKLDLETNMFGSDGMMVD
jgi:hypothetical protein